MFDLPTSTIVNRNVPKNSFDAFLQSKQKRLFSEYVDRIRWLNKLSADTINLTGDNIKEIQIFEVTLKKDLGSDEILNLIDRHIPYNIIFILKLGNNVKFSAAAKHSNPNQEDTAVIDWRFANNWQNETIISYKLILRESLDAIFSNFCFLISGKKKSKSKTFQEFIAHSQQIKLLSAEIKRLQAAIKSSRQFNKKVELNIELNNKLKQIRS